MLQDMLAVPRTILLLTSFHITLCFRSRALDRRHPPARSSPLSSTTYVSNVISNPIPSAIDASIPAPLDASSAAGHTCRKSTPILVRRPLIRRIWHESIGTSALLRL